MPSDLIVAEPPGGWADPWPQARELALHAPEGWVLVGGLMVDLHARLAGMTSRVTVDVDALLNIQALRMPTIDTALQELGYTFHPSIDAKAPAHRWLREVDDAAIDVLVPDHLAHPPRFRRRATVAAPGGTSVLTRHLTTVTVQGAGEDAHFTVPTLSGALVLKARAYLVDSRDPERHLDDLGTLLSTVEDYRAALAPMSASDQKHLRAALRPLHHHLQTSPGRNREVLRWLPQLADTLRLQPPLEHQRPPSPFRRRRR